MSAQYSNAMSYADYLNCPCQKCGDSLEFPPSSLGEVTDCPHCGEQTKLVSTPSKSVGKFAFIIGLVLFISCSAASSIAIYWRMTQKPGPPPGLASQTLTKTAMPKDFVELKDFQVGKITLQKADGSGLVYAHGTVTNDTDRQRFGVKIELDLFNAEDNKIGNASDYLAVLEPHKAWQFNALLTEPK